MHPKNYPVSLILKFANCLILGVLLLTPAKSFSQIYAHNFGTAAITAHPYTAAPTVIDSHLSGSSWSNSTGAWTSTAGSTGEAIRLTSVANATITLTFNVAANFQVDVSSFNFWRQRSNLGPQNWSMTINGINVGSGTTAIAGAAIGNTTVANAISGLTGTITVVLSLTGSTGNGTFRLDDFTLNGTVTSNCTGATVTSFLPLSGPQNTIVTINGSGFTGATSVKFNGIGAGSFTVVSDNVIKAYVPAGNTSGAIGVTVGGCESFAAVNFTRLVSVATPNYSSDIYITELYDAQVGDGGVIEIYNGTANPVNLSGYTIRRYGDIGGGTFYTINLTGTIPPGGIFLVGIGTGTTPCSITENQHYGTGFNSNDEFQLYNNGTLIDNVHAPTNVGYSVIRNPNAIAPKAVFNGADWNTSTTESCANIGIHNVPTATLPTVTQPVSTIACENNAAVFSTSLSPSAGFNYQWKMLNAAGVWVNVPNAAPYTGSNSATLTISPVAAAFDESQFYCQAISGGRNVVTNAAQLEVNALIVPDFATTLSLCQGATAPVLNAVSPNGISGVWNPSTINNTTSGTYIFTPSPGQCAASTTLIVTITNTITPDFATTISLCQGATVPVLNAVSPNGIAGVWNPSAISNTTSGTYVFTPSPGQCAASTTLTVTITNTITPDFATTLSLCQGATAPVLNAVSPNGITGVWNPSAISNTTSGTYIFTPNPGQCAASTTLNVTITNTITPDFATTLVLCQGATAPVLNAVSPNGISGVWNPSTISNTANGTYIFTPNPGQCAASTTLTVTITNTITPDFATTISLCQGATVPVLNAVSPNGITGVWNPSTISNTTSGTYIFTPNPGQCAASTTLTVTITNTITPDFATTLSLCQGAAVPVLNAVSPNGITGVWNPSAISNTTSGTYIFTPNPGQCAASTTLTVTITNLITPDFATTLSLCQGATAPVLNAVSPNGISGVWNPSAISNTTSGTYIFTPNPGQCAASTTLTVTITNTITPDFATTLSLCQGATAPVLNAVSPNGIAGVWNPSAISNTTSGTYVFTPNPGQCAASTTLAVTITNLITPDFATTLALCQGATVPVLNAVSPNGISGVWNPSTISNTTSATYTFIPDSGQCAAPVALSVVVHALPRPVLTDAVICLDQSGQIVNPAHLNTGIPNTGFGFIWTLDGRPLATTTSAHVAVVPGHYQVTVTNLATGCSATADANVSALAAFSAQVVSGGDFAGDGTITVLVSGGSGQYQFQLDQDAPQSGPRFFNVPAGLHTVTVKDVNGCGEMSFSVFLLDYPRFFTPNGDGFHDFWNIGGLSDQADSRIYIFDRYGKLIKSLKPNDEMGWDGTYNGRELPATDYWFELLYQDRSGNDKTFRAHFALKR